MSCPALPRPRHLSRRRGHLLFLLLTIELPTSTRLGRSVPVGAVPQDLTIRWWLVFGWRRCRGIVRTNAGPNRPVAL